MNDLSSYIPIDRRQAIFMKRPLSDRMNGAVLFADISGFTPLTERLLQELGQQRGAEELARYLNQVMDRLIQQLHQYRAVVIGFAGDAISCWLEGDDGHRAISCALKMQEEMIPFYELKTPGGQTVALSLKIAIAVGPVRRFLVGDSTIYQMDSLAGPLLDRVAAGEKLAEKNEILVCDAVVAGLRENIKILGWRGDRERFAVVGGLHQLAPVDRWEQDQFKLSEEETRQWIPEAVFRRLQSGDHFLAESRPAVPLFLRFSGIDYEADDAGEKLNRFICWVQGVLARFEGTLLQLIIGDKGSYLYGAFGAPVAHGDDSARALAASLVLSSVPAELDFIKTVQIGLSRGRIWAGVYGGSERGTYGILGHEVNIAARLMGLAAPGEIAVSGQLMRTAGGAYQYRSLGEVAVKGVQGKIPIFAVEANQTNQQGFYNLFTHPLVGRNSLLEQLRQMLKQSEREGQVVRIEGGAGMGKSHLTAVVARQATVDGWQVAVGAGQSTQQKTAYFSWQQLGRSLFQLEEDDEKSQFIEAVEEEIRQLDSEWLVRLPLLGDLLDLPIPDNGTTAAFEPKLRQEALFAFVVDLLQKWALEQKILLILDDVQWLDQASEAFSLAVARALPPGSMLLLVQRPHNEDEAPVLSQIAQFDNYQFIQLSEMSTQSMEELIGDRLGGRVSSLIVSLLAHRAQGNPFFVEELVTNLVETNQIYRHSSGVWRISDEIFVQLREANLLGQEEGEWVLLSGGNWEHLILGMPDSIHGVVLSRVDRLPEQYKQTLKIASVIGRRFELNLLLESHPNQPQREELLVQMDGVEARDMIRSERMDRSDLWHLWSYLFKHSTVHEVIYDTLLFTQRKQLHLAVGGALEKIELEAVERLAHHMYLAEEWEKGIYYHLQAGKQAQQRSANYAAVDHFRKAWECGQHLPELSVENLLTIELGLGELLVLTGDYEGGKVHLLSAIESSKEAGFNEMHIRACRWLARLHELQGEYEDAFSWIQQGLFQLDERKTGEVAELLLIAGLINIRQGDYENALLLCQEGMGLAQQLGETAVEARSYNLLALLTRIGGDITGAIEHLDRAQHLYEEVNNIHGLALVQNQIANSWFQAGDWIKADQHYQKALKIFVQIGDIYNQIFVDNNLGGLALNRGYLDEALRFYEQAIQAQAQIGQSLWVMGALNMNLGHVYLRKEDFEQARAYLLKGKDYFDQAQSRDFLPEIYRLFGELAVGEGQLQEGLEWGKKAIALGDELSTPIEEGLGYYLVGKVEVQLGDLESAEKTLNKALRILTEVSDRYWIAKCQVVLARLYEANGRLNESKHLLKQAKKRFKQLDARLDLAQIG